MAIKDIAAKVTAGSYLSLAAFDTDVFQMVSNCLNYNEPRTSYHTMASKFYAAFSREIKPHAT